MSPMVGTLVFRLIFNDRRILDRQAVLKIHLSDHAWAAGIGIILRGPALADAADADIFELGIFLDAVA